MVIKNETPACQNSSATSSSTSSSSANRISDEETSSAKEDIFPCKEEDKDEDDETETADDCDDNNDSENVIAVDDVNNINLNWPEGYYCHQNITYYMPYEEVGELADPLQPEGSEPSDVIMASAAVSKMTSMPAGPIFTSSDLPLQPYPPPTHNDLFVNPAFAHMSFLSDGSMVGPCGEIYSPAEYFPSLLVEHSQEVPAVIPVSPQPGDFPAGPAGPAGQAATPPPGMGKNQSKPLHCFSSGDVPCA